MARTKKKRNHSNAFGSSIYPSKSSDSLPPSQKPLKYSHSPRVVLAPRPDEENEQVPKATGNTDKHDEIQNKQHTNWETSQTWKSTMINFKRHILGQAPGLDTRAEYLLDRLALHFVNVFENLSYMRSVNTKETPVSGNSDLRSVTSSHHYWGLSKLATTSATGDRIDLLRMPSHLEGCLPATLECPTCYQTLTLYEPHDWEAHLLQDLHPFVCTFKECTDQPVFDDLKSWTTHERVHQGTTEAWSCDRCNFVRDNETEFLDHLALRHGLKEDPRSGSERPIVETGFARHKLEQCYIKKTAKRPRPLSKWTCIFCGIVFLPGEGIGPSHLAQHMMSIALSFVDPWNSTIRAGRHFKDSLPLTNPLPPILPADSLFQQKSFRTHEDKPRTERTQMLRHWESAPPELPATPFYSKDAYKMESPYGSSPFSTPEPPCKVLPSTPKPIQIEAGHKDDTSSSPSTSGSKAPLISDADPNEDAHCEETDVQQASSLSIIYPSSPEPATGPLPNPRARQVGLARIRIEQVSFTRMPALGADSDSEEWYDEEDDQDDTDGEEDGDIAMADSGAENSTNSGGQSAESSNQSQSNDSRSRLDKGKGPATGQETGSGGGDQDDEDSSGNREPVAKPLSKLKNKKPTRRLACPYQKFYGSNCLRKSTRNREGGCQGINHLRQHLNRKHRLSFRCQRCWQSFDQKSQVAVHAEDDQCERKLMSNDEWFMGSEVEDDIDKPCRPGCEENTWFDWFRKLIPGMGTREVSELKQVYSPYYTDMDGTWTLPAMALPPSLFQISQPELPISDSQRSGTNDPFLSTLHLSSGSASVPIMEVSGSNSTAVDSLFSGHPAQSSIAQSETSMPDFSTAGSSSQMTSASSLQSNGIGSQLSESQVRRNYERLKVSSQATEIAMAETTRAIADTGVDLTRIDGVLEDLLGSENLTSHVYDKLTEVLSIVGCIKKRLR